MATFVLVHGSFHGGWCWQRVAGILRHSAHEVYAPTLTGLGERRHLATRETGLELHIEDIVHAIEYEDLRDVVLVGHSYAGLVIAGVAERVPARVSRLIFLDALIPHDGESAFDLMPGMEGQWAQLAAAHGEGWLVPPMPARALGISVPADVAWVESRLSPMPLLTHRQPIRLASNEASKLPRTYILCTQFGFEATAREAEGLGWDVFRLETGHDAMITVPEDLAQALTKAIANRGRR